MTAERDVERVLEHWLVDGIDEMPDRVYLAILDRVERQPQQRAWRVSWRDSTVNAYIKPILAMAAVIVIVVAGIGIVGGPSRSGIVGVTPPSASPSAAPSPSVAPSPSATQAWTDPGPCGENGCGGPLTAGTYTSTALQPPVTYTLTSPWVNVRDWAEYFMLYPDNPGNRALWAIGESAPYILILPDGLAVSPTARCEGDPAADAVEVDAAGYAASLAAREGLATTGPIPITVGGLTGLQLDVDLEPGGDTGCAPDVPVQPLGEAIGSNDHYRLVVLDAPDGGTLLIRIWAAGDADAFFRDAMPVVESFEFDLSHQPSPSP
jgi:hypothetical protein